MKPDEQDALSILDTAIALIRSGRECVVSVGADMNHRETEIYGGHYDIRGVSFREPRLTVSITEAEKVHFGLADMPRVAREEMRAAGVSEAAMSRVLYNLDNAIGAARNYIAEAPGIRRHAQQEAARVAEEWKPR